jgi:hypothetical protein
MQEGVEMASRSGRAVRAVTVLAAAIVGLGSQTALAANAPLVARGPLSPVHPFPLWYQDASAAPGVKLEPCLQLTGCVLPATGLSAPLDTAAPIRFPNNFPSTAVYGYANVDVPVFDQTSGKLAQRGLSYTAQLIATFGALGGNFDPLGAQVWTQINFVTSATLLPNQTYTIAHPYGTFTLATDAAGDLCQNRNQGGRNPCDIRFPAALAALTPFDGVLSANPSLDPNDATVGTFLKQVGAPAGSLGDGVTRSGISGSPAGQNFIRISGPGVGTSAGNACSNGLTTDCIEIGGAVPPKGQGFVVAGRIFDPAGGATTQLWITDAATASPGGAQPRIDFRGVAGVPQTLTIHAVDVNGNITAGYSGTVALTSNDPLAAVPLTATLTGGTGTFTVTPHTASPGSTPSFAIAATDGTSVSGSGSGLVNGAPATGLLVTGLGPSSAGAPTSFSVTAIDPFGNIDRNFAGTVSFASSDPQATLPAVSPVLGGTGTFSATFRTAGSVSLTVDAGPTLAPGVATATVAAGPAVSMAALSGDGQAAAAGSALPAPFVVLVHDTFGNPVPGVAVTFTPPAGGSVSASPATTGADGRASSIGTLPTLLGSYAFTAAAGALAGSPASFAATALHGPPATLTLSGAASTTAGTSTPVSLAVLDQFGNPCSTTNGIVSFTTSDAAPAPAPALITGGLGSASMVFHTAGTQTLGGVLVGAGVSGSYATAVSHAAASDLVLVSGNLQSFTVGLALPQPLVVRVTDAFGNAISGASVSFAALTPGASVSPLAAATAADGTAQAVATLASAVVGTQTFSAASGLLVGSPLTITATAAPAVPASVSVSIPGAATAGAPTAFTITVRDQFGNVSTGFNGGVSFASTDPAATLPAASTLGGGTGSFSVTFRTAGSRTVSATVTTVPPLSGTSAAVAVAPAAPATIAAVSGGGQTGVVGTALAQPLVALVSDAFGNPVPGVAVAFTGSASPNPATTGATGTVAATATLPTTSGAASFAGSVAGLATPASFAETAVPAAPTAVTLAGVPTPGITAGVAFAVTVRAFDPFGNAATNFGGAVAISSSDPAAVLPAGATFTAGVTAALPVTLRSAGARTVTATIVGVPAATASSPTTVTAAAASALAATSGGNQAGTVGTLLGAPFVVTVSDAFGNPVAGVPVAFTAPATGSIASPVVTGANGQAAATGTLGHGAGAQSFTASAAGLTPPQVTFAATANPGVAAALAISGLAASTTAGAPASFTLTATDQFGNAATGFIGPVTFSSTDSAAALPGPSPLTAGAGAFSVTFRTSGARALTASSAAPALTSAAAPTTVAPAAPATISVVSGSGQTGAVATAFTTPFVAHVQDQFANSVPGVTVTFAAPPGASVSPITATTSAAGTASAIGTLPSTPGTISYAASTAGVATPASFSATAVADVPATMTLSGLGAAITAGASASVTVAVFDRFNNACTNFNGPITLASSDAQAALPAAPALVAGSGIFSVTFRTAGAQSATAALSANPAVTATAAASVGAAAAATVALVSGTGQTGTVGVALAAPFVVRVSDAFGNPVPGAVVSFAAPVTGSIAAAVVTGANGQASATGTLGQTAGAQAFTATAAGLAGSPVSFAATANAGAAASLAIGALPGSTTAGVAATFAVTATDQFGNTATGFTGPITFASSDPQAALPAASSLAGGVGSFSVTFRTAGARTVTALSASPALTSNAAATIVAAGPAASLAAVSGSGQTGTVGAALAAPFVVKVSDAFGNAVSGTAVSFTPPATGGVTLAAATAADGTTSATGTLAHGSGAQTFTASAAGVATPVAFLATANPGAPTTLTLSALPAGVTAGVATPVSLAAFDGFGNACTNFSGALTFTASDPAFAPPAAALVLGAGTASVTLVTAGSRTVTAFIASLPGVTATQGTSVVAGPAASLAVVSGASQSGTVATALGAPFVVKASDAFGNAVSGVVVSFGAPATGSITPISTATIADGTASATGTLGQTAGAQTFTASAGTLGGSPVSLAATAVPGAAANLTLAGLPASVPAGATSALTATALDQFGNTATGSNAAIAVTSTDPAAVLPAASSLASGVASLPVALKTTGARSVTVSIAGPISASASTIVTPAATGSIAVVSAPTSAAVGAAAAVATVVVKDTLGNVVPNATVTFGAPAGASITPTTSTTNAQGVASATPTVGTTATSYAFTATVLTFSTSFTVTATPGAATSLTIGALAASATAGVAAPFTVTASDQFGNTATGFSGPVTFASSDPQAVLPGASALVNGAGSFSATFKTAGVRTVTALSAAPALTSPATSTTVAPAAAASIALVSGSGQTGTAGAALAAPFVVRVADAFGNAVAGTSVSFAAPATGLVAGSATTAASGQASATGTLGHTAGPQVFTASAAGLAGSPVSFAATATPGAAAALAVGALPGSTTAGVAASFTVTATDQFGNTATGFVGPVTFASNDAQAVLPAASPLAGGVGSFSATFKTAGARTVTALSATPALTSNAAAITVAAGAAATIAAVSGDRQAGAVGAALGAPFVVKVSDAFGNAIAGAAVTFTAPATGSVTLAAATAVDGTTSATGTLPTGSGAATFVASAPSVASTVTFTAQASPAAPATLALTGLPPTTTAGVASPVQLAAFDRFGNACTNFTGAVSFASTDPGMTPAGASLALGVGAANVTFVTAGGQALTATLTAVPAASATQSTTVSAGAASSVAVVSGAGQSGTVGAALAAPFVVRATDLFGNPVAAVLVAFGAPATGSVTPQSATTLADGTASATGTLGHGAGAQTFTASAAGLGVVSLGATANAAAPATLTATGMPPTVAAGAAVSLLVTALDPFGNTATGSNAALTVTSTDAAAVLPAGATLASGVASIQVQFKTTGSASATLLVPGAAPVTLGTTVTPAAIASIAAVPPSPTTATVGTAAAAVVFEVKDTLGNVVPGKTVAFAAAGAGGSISPASAVTDAQGRVSAVASVGTSVGSYSFTATVATFTATVAIQATPGAADHLVLTPRATASAVLDCGCYDLDAQLKDSFGNAVATPLGSIGATASGSAVMSAPTNLVASLPGPTPNIAGGTLQPDGSALIHVCDALPEQATVTISAPAASPAVASASQNLTWTLGPVDAARTGSGGGFAIDHPTLVAWSGRGHVTVKPLSACGNPIGAGQAVSFTLTGPGTLTPALDVGDGSYTTTLSVMPCPASGATQVDARVGSVDLLPLPVTVSCVAPDAARSTVSFTRTEVSMCDDLQRDQVTVTVTPRDSGNAPLGPGNTMVLGMAGLSGGAVQDVGDGSYAATFSSASCGAAAHPMTISVDGVDIATAPLAFTCSPVVAATSGVTAAGSGIADGHTAVSVTVVASNDCGEPARHRPVKLATDIGTLLASAGTTDEAGSFTTALTSAAGGRATVSATVDGVALAPAQVTFGAPPRSGGCGIGGEGGLAALAGLVAALVRRRRR